MGFPIPGRIWRKSEKIITLTGAANFGQNASACTIYTITGTIWLIGMSIRATTTLVSGGGGSLALGVTGNTSGLIPATTATLIASGSWWQDATPEVGVSPAIKDFFLSANMIATTSVADITAGVLEFEMFWLPLSNNANVT